MARSGGMIRPAILTRALNGNEATTIDNAVSLVVRRVAPVGGQELLDVGEDAGVAQLLLESASLCWRNCRRTVWASLSFV